jgi:deazaflavin-dependent oxidoreductase (nitroreductase family)
MLRFALRLEELIMTRLVPHDNPGPIFRRLFKIPILFYKIGLPLFGDFILLLTTTGRKTGKIRQTPLEYRLEPGTGCFIVMAGWGGKTDWYRNACTHPRVRVQAGRRKFEALAEPLPEEDVAAWLIHTVQINPASLKIWSRWAGETLDGSDAGLRRAARHFPSLRLRQVPSS